ncbi:MAG TPA: glucuronate isomerase, partial [Polyangiaceae bacterium]|nr:glucuronate isomerase [Polyangiaceae bacterium]
MNPSKLSVYDEDFLLENDVARELYHDHAKHQPIIDYHCHLPPEHVAKNHRFRTITEIWLDGDHYKWRALRTNGIPEVLVTGPAGDWDRFSAWARTVPKTLKNPLYHFTHLELKKPFGIRDRLLSADTARGIYDDTNFRLADPEYSALGLMRQFNVAAVCTTDDPADDLVHHRAYRESPAWDDVRMFPSFRPDGALEIEDPSALRNYVTRLGEVSGVDISSFNALLEALDRRHAAFHELGCRLSDHGLETMFSDDFSESEVEQIFEQALRGRVVDPGQAQRYRSALLYELARLDSARGWTQQFHLGAIRG